MTCWTGSATRAPKGPDGLPRHVTRMWPKRAEELLAGGSLYWVFKGSILARQCILRLDEAMGADGIARCAIVLDPHVVRTHAATTPTGSKGWRYLKAEDAPPDLPKSPRRAMTACRQTLMRCWPKSGLR